MSSELTRLDAIYALASPEARAKIDAMTPEQRAMLVTRCANMFIGAPRDVGAPRND